jgi:hypothetical protein
MLSGIATATTASAPIAIHGLLIVLVSYCGLESLPYKDSFPLIASVTGLSGWFLRCCIDTHAIELYDRRLRHGPRRMEDWSGLSWWI